jgi:ABC-type glycerol-3-phosphate transport system substrate-binding protein
MEERKVSLSRRAFLQAMAATGVVVACGATPQVAPSGSAKPATLSGTVTVSYPDELGAKPKYVEKAAADLKSKYSGVDVKIDLQKISSDDYYTKLLLALSGGGDVPDVIHVGGDRIGELADAGYIEPLDRTGRTIRRP